MYKRSGFTIIELMVAVAIIGVLTAIAVPNYLEWLPDSRLKDVARGIYGDMQLAKLNAIKENKEWAIVFDPVNKKYYLCSDKGTGGVWNTSSVKVKTVEFPELSGIQLGKGNATKDAKGGATDFGSDYINFIDDKSVKDLNHVTFSSIGAGYSGYVYIENVKKTAYAIGKENAGFIKIKKWTGSDWK